MARPTRKVTDPDPRHRYPGEVMDLTGQRYGRLTGVRFARRTDDGRSIWTWRCDCGRLTEKRADYVRSGQTHSCGCLRKRMEPLPRASRLVPRIEAESPAFADLGAEEHW